MAKNLIGGPTGALITTVDQSRSTTRVSMLFLIPVVTELAVSIRLFGTRRNELTSADDGEPLCRMTLTAEQSRCPNVLRPLQSAMAFIWPAYGLYGTELEVDARLMRRVKHVGIYAGERDASGSPEGEWEGSSSTFVLEASKRDLGVPATGSLFLLLTRQTSSFRTEALWRGNRVLQSDSEPAADALWDLYFLLISGKDIQLMTEDLGGVA